MVCLKSGLLKKITTVQREEEKEGKRKPVQSRHVYQSTMTTASSYWTDFDGIGFMIDIKTAVAKNTLQGTIAKKAVF